VSALGLRQVEEQYLDSEFRGCWRNECDRYVHPEFGLLSPTPRLRRELRVAFFSLLFGIGIGAAAVIALSGNNTANDARVPHGVGSASIISEDGRNRS
jgi:hypothetical protein